MKRFLATTALSLILAGAALAQTGSKSETNSTTARESEPRSDSRAVQNNRSSKAGDVSQSQSPSSTSSASDKRSEESERPNSSPSTTSAKSAHSDKSTANPQTNRQDSARPSDHRDRADSSKQATPDSASKSQQTSNPQPSNQAAGSPRDGQAEQSKRDANQTDRGSSSANTADRANTRDNEAGQASQRTAEADRGNVKLSDQQRTQVGQAVSKLNVRPVTNVNFSLSIGTVVPRDVQLATLPRDVVDIVPEYRGYSFALVKDELVIVDPATYKIVTVLPYSARTTASVSTGERSKVSFSEKDREVIRKHAKNRVEGRTTGSAVRSEIRMGERVPESVEVEEFPEDVYRDAPTLREYRYINRADRTYIIEPHERRVIEEIE